MVRASAGSGREGMVEESSAAAAYRSLVERLCESPEVSETRMMGMPALKRAGKLLGGFWDEALVVRLGRDRVDALVESGRGLSFDPSGRGRPMRDWVAVPPPVDDWLPLGREAAARLDDVEGRAGPAQRRGDA
jgi:hypothetical protein